MRNRLKLLAVLGGVVLIALVYRSQAVLRADTVEPVALEDKRDALLPAIYFAAAMGANPGISKAEGLAWLDAHWDTSFLPYFIEVFRFGRDAEANIALLGLLHRKTGDSGLNDLRFIRQYIWKQDLENTPGYAFFKQFIHKGIDERFVRYFEPTRRFDIRLDEVAWGGVLQDGIPPLRQPKMIPASDAEYLDDSNIVFGIEIEGEARAYPKRILAWHEMFVDTISGVSVAGVYCTLCGSVVIYETEFNGVNHELGTSGFLYRSNKLMYDRATQSLWSTLEGEPVIGPLAGKGIRLRQRSVVTTTWGAWKARHPGTTVLSLQTGHKRDYGEGVAYRDYFATDTLMFDTPFKDARLKNKAEVLALRFIAPGEDQVAISTDFLNENPLFQAAYGGQPIVVLTDKGGAHRVYERPSTLRFSEWDGISLIVDNQGGVWKLSESMLENKEGATLKRLPAHRAFWFGWYAAFPGTRLIQ